MARMGFLDKAEELDVMIEAERAVLKKVKETIDQLSLRTNDISLCPRVSVKLAYSPKTYCF